ncbi:hypothetical protein DQ237_08215 [Blastococcus sp. TF02-8]|uniref:hypothetical protein n=1 Tax=Blastococcus sp. TF02-8 TaxID=2250574 RepID=UPI000DEB6BD5|nr:hypothetical protein [Blastococcus sp. TF02-8]RBY96602.1 hypothetical protein DQ237_08215 [Blastococcus sp. TF02-8]
MGASGWNHVTEYLGDPESSLQALRRQVLASGDYLWDDENDYPAPRPASLAELDEIRRDDDFWEVGTHSVLDVDRVVPMGPDQEAAVQQLDPEDAELAFGTTTPTRETFELAELDVLPWGERWSGRYQVIYDGGRPTHIAFWGSSGD